jgi:hypothetical protein
MDSVDQAASQAWRLWAKLAAPALLRCPVLGISAVLVVATPLSAAARVLPGTQDFISAEPTQRQMRVVRSYERYLSRMRAQTVKAREAVRFAYRQVGKPYQWGGAGPRTYDCSGLVMAAWRRGGLRLPHRADLQHRMIRRKVGLKNLRPGDLVFFSGDHHVGIYVGRRHFLHAPHTGARVQRGTLTGWRLRVFAGAARPGAPAYHAWPQWVRALADVKKATHTHAHHTPSRTPERWHPPAETPDTASAGLPSTIDPAGPVEPIQQEVQGPEDDRRGPYDETAAPSASRWAHATGGHHHPADPPPAPRPAPPPRAAAGSQAGIRPGDTVRRQNDEQRIDRDFRGSDDYDNDDDGDAGDGIDLRSLLGDTR